MKYPQDLLNQIVCCNCLETANYIPDGTLDGVVIDPPYGENMGYDGDNSLTEASDLLLLFLKKVESKVKRNGHIAIFWTMRNLDVCIDTLRSAGFIFRRVLSMYIPKGNARPYIGWLPRTQAIVIGQKYLPQQPSEFHFNLTQYLKSAMDKKGVSRPELAKRLNCDSRLIMKWTRENDPSWCLPTPRFYKPLKEILDLDDQFDVLLHRESVHTVNQRNDFDYKHDTYIVDYKNNKEMVHPSQKPLEVLEHIVSCLSPKNGIIFDGFGGSGTTALACKNTERNFIVSEISPEFCEIAKKRLSNS